MWTIRRVLQITSCVDIRGMYSLVIRIVDALVTLVVVVSKK